MTTANISEATGIFHTHTTVTLIQDHKYLAPALLAAIRFHFDFFINRLSTAEMTLTIKPANGHTNYEAYQIRCFTILVYIT